MLFCYSVLRMSSIIESQSKNNNIQKSELAPDEKVVREMEEYIKDAELSSPRFQAFSDLVDWQKATLKGNRKEASMADVIRLGLIEETIRQRQNGVTSYRR